MLNVRIDTTPLENGSSIRGVGMYTRFLIDALKKKKEVHLIEGKKENVDIVHYPFFDLFFATLPVLNPHPTVITIHDVIPLLFPKEYKSGKRGRIAFYRQFIALRGVQAIITDSNASKKDIHKYLKISQNKIHVVYLAGNPHLKKADTNFITEVRQKLQLPEKYILYVGDINYNKNLPQLIKSLKYLPDDVALVCVGKNFSEQNIPEWRWIETQIAMSDVANRVRFVNDIGTEDTQTLSAIYSGAVCLVQPSLYEGFGLPVLEAMQCHTPVVSAKNSSLVEVGGNHVYFVEIDAESIGEGVNEVLAYSKNKRDAVVKAAFDWSQTFSWKKVAAETIQVYEMVMKSRSKK
jgi:glycosyltransferase involved in cell wall biosynthesis